FGMLIGLLVYLRGQRYLPADPARRVARVRGRLTAEGRGGTAVLAMLVPVLASFWIPQTQVWNVYNVWARDHVDLQIAGWTMPVPWLQSITGPAPLAIWPL